MGYHYAIIPSSRAPDHDIDPKRHAIHLGQQCLLGDFLLLVSLGTPMLVLDPRCAIIGHLFRRGGSQVLNGAEISRFATSEERENHLLGEFWGDYVLLQSPESDTGALAVTRDPSGGMPCFYGGQHDGRFITSDITFAVALGLYSKEIDWHHVRHSLTFPYLRTQRTGLAGIGELLPGCRLTMCERDTKVRQVWSPWPFVAPERRHADPREAASAIREALRPFMHGRKSMARSCSKSPEGWIHRSWRHAWARRQFLSRRARWSRPYQVRMSAPMPGR